MRAVTKTFKSILKNLRTATEGEDRSNMLELELGEQTYPANEYSEENRRKEHVCKTTCLTLIIVAFVIGFIFFFPQLLTRATGYSTLGYSAKSKNCQNIQHNSSCQITLVESIPEGLIYPNDSINPSIYDSWLRLIESAEISIDIASFYWSLNGKDVIPSPSAWQGENIFTNLKSAALERGVRIRIAQNQPSKSSPDKDTEELAAIGAATVRNLDFNRLVGAGILHTKLWIVDGKHFFVGSANMDWRALTQVKELGATVYNCSCLAEDVSKLFEIYWSLGEENATIPEKWPKEFSTKINHLTPLEVALNQTTSSVYLSSSPPQLCPNGRTGDLEAILHTMSQANKYINIAVMDYIPAMLYTPHHQFWPDIDTRLRQLAIDKGIKIRLLVSHWKHTTPAMLPFLKSLADIANVYPQVDVQVRIFVVPTFTPDQEKIPFARVNHNKYMVTDQAAYIGTSNWSGDYFLSTGGVGLIVNSTSSSEGDSTLQSKLKEVFDRDWNSAYAHSLDSSHVVWRRE